MRSAAFPRKGSVALALAVLTGLHAPAVRGGAAPTQVYWDPAHLVIGSGGPGTWTAPNSWSNGVTDFTWGNSLNFAPNFGGASAGTVDLGGNVVAFQGINFNTPGYTIAGAANQTLTLNGVITGSATISANLADSDVFELFGGGQLTIAGQANVHSGGFMIVENGTLAVTTGGAFVANGVNPIVAYQNTENAALSVSGTGSFTTDGTLTLSQNGGTGTIDLSGSGAITAGALILAENAQGTGGEGDVLQTGGTLTTPSVAISPGSPSGAATYGLYAGILATGAISGGGFSSLFDFAGGTLQATADNAQLFTGVNTVQIANAGAIINTNGHSDTIVVPLIPAISSVGGLTKQGAGTLTLAATPTYTGPTSVEAGTLLLASDLLSSSLISISPGATLEYSNASNLSINPGTYYGTGTLLKTGAGKLICGAGAGAINMNFSSGALVDIEGGQLVGSSSYSGNWTNNQASLNIAAGASFDAVEGGLSGDVQIGALTGAGTFSGGYLGNENDTTILTLGAGDASGLFSGSLMDDSAAHLFLVKTGAGTETFSGPNTYTGGTSISAGTLLINAAQSVPNSSISISPVGELKFATGIGGVTIQSLSISIGGSANGTFDITNNHLFINYGAGLNADASILSYLKAGSNNGHWNGPGITSSTATANTAYGVGFADGQSGIVAGLSSGTLEIAYTLYGDINLDGVVNGTDFGILAANFGKSVTAGWEQGDLNYDGVVNGSDFGLLAGNFGKSASGQAIALPASQWAALDAFAAAHNLLADVPEPSCVTCITLFAATLMARVRRRTR
jgi:fibronectin-binding autotransporter adhesin